MRYDIILAPQAINDLRALKAHLRSTVRDAIEEHPRHEPTKVSKSRIKRLRGISRPEYRLRVGEVRIFYDVSETTVEILAIVPKSEAESWLKECRRIGMKKVALSEVKDDLSKYLRVAEKEEIVITRHGKPAGVLIGFVSEDDWFDYRLENDPRFLRRIEAARQSIRSSRGVRFEDIEK
jgi:mRNA interferase RelE/StbE